MTEVATKPLVRGNTLITSILEEERALAIMFARHTIHAISDDLDLLKNGRAQYAHDPCGLMAASHVLAVEFETIAASNNYWRP